MIRNLKVLGLALAAVFAMSAIAASAASAADLTAESYPATVTGAPQTGTVDTFTTTAGKVKCPNASYTGTVSAATTTVSITPNFNGPNDTCTALAGIVPTIIHPNGCTFLFHIEAGVSTGTVDIVCPAGNEITITANENTAGTLTTKCTIHVPPQTGIGPLSYSTTGSGTTREIRLSVAVTNGIQYTETAGSGLGACETTTKVQTDGTYSGTDLLTGEVDGGSTHIGLFLS